MCFCAGVCGCFDGGFSLDFRLIMFVVILVLLMLLFVFSVWFCLFGC